jgi:hypothetical protein
MSKEIVKIRRIRESYFVAIPHKFVQHMKDIHHMFVSCDEKGQLSYVPVQESERR